MVYTVFDSIVRREDNAGIITLRQKNDTLSINDSVMIFGEEIEFFDELLGVDSLIINVEKNNAKFTSVYFRPKITNIKFTENKQLVLNRDGDLVLSTKDFYDFLLGFLLFKKQPYFYTIYDPINNQIFTTLNHIVCRLDLPSTINQSIFKSMGIIHRFNGFKKITCRWVDVTSTINHKILHPTIHHTPKQIQQLLNHDFITGGILLQVTGLRNSEQSILFQSNPRTILTNSCEFEYGDDATPISSNNYSFYHLLVHLASRAKQPRQKNYSRGYVAFTGSQGVKYTIDDFNERHIISNVHDFYSRDKAQKSYQQIIDRINRHKLSLGKQRFQYLITLWRRRQEKIKQIKIIKDRLIYAIKEKSREIQEINTNLLKKWLSNWAIKIAEKKAIVHQKKQDAVYALQQNAIDKQQLRLYFNGWADYAYAKSNRRFYYETIISNYLNYKNELVLEQCFDAIKLNNKINREEDENPIGQLVDTMDDTVSNYLSAFTLPVLGIVLATISFYVMV